MNRYRLTLLLFSVLIILLGCTFFLKEKQPNILIIYADDLGWSDIGCYGSEKNETPNLDKLAFEGLRFTNAYAAAPICSASRASIMTGKSPARLHFETVSTDKQITNKPLLPPKRTLELPLKEITLGEITKDAGYKTAFFGKWHIAKHNGEYLKWSDTHGPLQQGFDVGSDNYGSHPYDKKNRDMVYLPERTFPKDSLVIKSINFLKEQQNANQPFLMIFSSYYVHEPVIPNNSWLIQKYRSRLPNASENEIKYAAFVETMDYYYGQLLNALKEFGLEDNTIVIFTSDNGGHPGYTDNTPLHGNKWTLYEGGIREPFIVRWPTAIKGNTESCVPIIQWDILPTLCELFKINIPHDIDGKSILSLIRGKSSTLNRNILYWHFPYYHPPISYEGTKPCSAIRDGNYKLIYFYEDDHIELYNLGNDLKEQTDLSSQMPEKAYELKSNLFRDLKKVNARFATVNPDYTRNE
ncbi:MAG: sulfatase [Draconibacterium sp.]